MCYRAELTHQSLLTRHDTISLLCYRAKETHQLAEANQEKNQRLREAFGLTDYVDGSAFDPNRKAKEEAAKAAAMATKKYAYVSGEGGGGRNGKHL